MWHFRLTVPRDLWEAIDVRILKRSLHTRDPVGSPPLGLYARRVLCSTLCHGKAAGEVAGLQGAAEAEALVVGHASKSY
jgi:hypothetical protein